MKRKEFLCQEMKKDFQKEKEYIRKRVLASAISSDKNPTKKRRPMLIAGGIGAAACAAAVAAVCLTGNLISVPYPEDSAASVSQASMGESLPKPLEHSFTLSLRYADGEAPLTNTIDMTRSYNRYFWADEEETKEAIRQAEEMGLGWEVTGEVSKANVTYYQEGFQQPKNFVLLRGNWLRITGENLQSVRLSCETGEIQFFSNSIWSSYRDRYEEYQRRYPKMKTLEEMVIADLGLESVGQLPWRLRGKEITMGTVQLQSADGWLDLRPTSKMRNDMLYEKGYSYDNWADTVTVTATFTDETVQQKIIHVQYNEDGVQLLTVTDA